MTLKTKSGAVPVQTEVPFSFSTDDVQSYLQKKFNNVTDVMKKNGINQGDVNILVTTLRCSKKFMPFLLVLPLNTLEGKQNRHDNELDIFNPDSSERSEKLKQPFYNLVGAYTYNKKDGDAFFSPEWRRALGISVKISHMLKSTRTPKIQKVNKGKNQYVVVLIDPIRIFHDMLENVEDATEKFKVQIDHVEQIKAGNYRYEIKRVRGKNKKNKNYDEAIIERELSQRLIGSR